MAIQSYLALYITIKTKKAERPFLLPTKKAERPFLLPTKKLARNLIFALSRQNFGAPLTLSIARKIVCVNPFL